MGGLVMGVILNWHQQQGWMQHLCMTVNRINLCICCDNLLLLREALSSLALH